MKLLHTNFTPRFTPMLEAKAL